MSEAGRPVLPPPRAGGGGTPYAVAVVCLGNICRSPMAAVVLRDRVAAAGLGDAVAVTSAGTGGWHVGEPMDPRAAATLTAAGYDPSGHRVRAFTAGWLEDHDLVLTMDERNLADVSALGSADRVRRFRDLDPLAGPGDREVPDPYFGGDEGFEDVLAMVERTCDALVAALADTLADTRADVVRTPASSGGGG